MPIKREREIYYAAGFVSLATFLIYLSSLRNDFVPTWDDSVYVLENPFIRNFSPDLIRHAFSGFYAANWHPLTWISHALDYLFWGMNPSGHHFTSTFIHALNTFLVVVLISRLVDAVHQKPSSAAHTRSVFASGVAGLLFGLHPLHVESVAWVSERKDLLCALFFLLAILRYIKNVKNRPPAVRGAVHNNFAFDGKYMAVFGFFVLALLSKPMAVTLPFVLLILDWYPFDRIKSIATFWSAFVEKIPFLALSLVSSAVTLVGQSASAVQSFQVIPLSVRSLVAIKSILAYLKNMLWPFQLMPFYPYPNNVSLISPAYPVFIMLFGILAGVCLILVKKQKVFLSVFSYYLITLVPVIGFIQVGPQSMADRYTYLPGIGLFLLIGLGAAHAWIKAQNAGKLVYRAAVIGILVFAAVSLMYLTLAQIRIWKNDITLWSYEIEKIPNGAPLAYNNRGNALAGSGQLEQAIADYNRAVELDPRYCEVYYNRGIAYGRKGMIEDSLKSFSTCLALDCNKIDGYISRGVTYSMAGQFDRALDDFNAALSFDPNRQLAYLNRGKLYGAIGNREAAKADYFKACELGNESGCEALQLLTAR